MSYGRRRASPRTRQALDEAERQRLLADTLDSAATIRPSDLSAKSKETLNLFQTIRRVARSFGMRALGGHVVSMTHQPSDLLTVLWLWKWSEQTDGGHPLDAELRLPIIPLFETISDLKRATRILSGLLDTLAYREWVRAQGDQQTVMIGYSDSTKDGGYLAACWALQRGQEELFQIAHGHGVHVTFFHGRGGSLGRGGGPAARAILSLPSAAFDGSLRLTEQGEILAERYDDPHIAYRHLEQVIWSVLTASTRSADYIEEQWRSRMDEFADVSYQAYRKLVDHKSFGQFFRHATPISDIESLHIASRPARRTASDRIEDLRAIPWVFAWTQSRCLLPAWYGVGTAFGELLDSAPQAIAELRTMYGSWPFFRAVIDNAVLAVAKSNRLVFEHYGQLAANRPRLPRDSGRNRPRVGADRRGAASCDRLRGALGRHSLVEALDHRPQRLRRPAEPDPGRAAVPRPTRPTAVRRAVPPAPPGGQRHRRRYAYDGVTRLPALAPQPPSSSQSISTSARWRSTGRWRAGRPGRRGRRPV